MKLTQGDGLIGDKITYFRLIILLPQKQNDTLKNAADEKNKSIKEKKEMVQVNDELLSQRADTITDLEQNVKMLTR